MPLTATLWVSRPYYFTNNTTHKMKTPLLLISILCGMALTSIAAPRSLSQAKAIAAKFAAQKGGSAKKAARRALTCARASEADRPYYVFNQGDNQGFTIVSADDVLPEIVGYADTGAFYDGNMPEGLAAFMDAYRKTATAILAGDKDATDNMNKLTAIRSAGKATAVSPLLGSMAWNQSEPYNNQCPLWNGTDRAVTELDRNDEDEDDEDEDAPEIEDHYNDPDEDDDAFDDDKLTEESYRTTFEDPENLGLEDAEDVADDDY